MVGDRKHDVLGAKSCSIEPIGVKLGYTEESELESVKDKYIIDSVEKLKGFLLNK